MTQVTTQSFFAGMDAFCHRIDEKKRAYTRLLERVAEDDASRHAYQVTDADLFNELLACFGPVLTAEQAKVDLRTVYTITFHKPSGALVIANAGATLFSLSPKTQTPHLVRHIGLAVYLPGMGVEMVNVGLVGNVSRGRVVLRSESACTPSFLFGSQRCNCAHQWQCTDELAADVHKINPPTFSTGAAFERWVQTQGMQHKRVHIFDTSGPGFVLLHIDTQNGMGSGFSQGEFAFDLFTRASLRHRGEYSSEQIHKTTMSGGFEAIGLRPDPRHEHDRLGYFVTPIVLDVLGISKELVLLSNNLHKINTLQESGYDVRSVRLVGEVNLAGAQEAQERGSEFHHLAMNGECISFQEEYERLKADVLAALYG